ncbi:hypothetical protein F5144DRAFT_590097 [Chaetomium tenue]|uniref:Uncharacterized protein n=1 Tax=Chaetomium tenue TaxID=1854479 RepID=A0ACB7PHX1_9PEZI|nr:hypothetical protein F5144DRAFT_590097 [Chaetomium globosum]
MERRGRCIEFRLSAFVDELRTRRCMDVLCANKMETQIQLDARCTQAPRNDETGAPRPIGPAAARDAEMSPAEWPAKVHSQVQPCGGGFRPQAFDWLVWGVKHVETSGPRGRPSVMWLGRTPQVLYSTDGNITIVRVFVVTVINDALCGLVGPCTARHAGCERLISMAPVRYHWVVPSTAMCADKWCITKGGTAE